MKSNRNHKTRWMTKFKMSAIRFCYFHTIHSNCTPVRIRFEQFNILTSIMHIYISVQVININIYAVTMNNKSLKLNSHRYK